jgi:UDP-N-acetylmuramate dehydrogenase
MNLPRPYASRLLHDEPLARYTAARLGGAADLLYMARESTDELVEVVSAAWARGVPVCVLGGGANVLVSDRGFRGLVVINHVAEISFGDWHDGRNAAATGGTGLTVLARKSAARGLSGLEWAASVPGTVGGAVVNNAGAHGGDMAATLCDAVVLDARYGPQLMTCDELTYGYRTSILKRALTGAFWCCWRPSPWKQAMHSRLARRWTNLSPIANGRSRRARAWAASSKIQRATSPGD